MLIFYILIQINVLISIHQISIVYFIGIFSLNAELSKMRMHCATTKI